MRFYFLLALCLSICHVQAAPLFYNPFASITSIFQSIECSISSIPSLFSFGYSTTSNKCSAATQAVTSTVKSTSTSSTAKSTSTSSVKSTSSLTTSTSSVKSTSSSTTSTSSVKSTSSVNTSTSSVSSITSTSSSSSTSTVSSSTSVSSSSTLATSKTSTSSTLAADVASGTPCAGNTAADRSKWCDYSTSTDYYNEVPNTGVTREYWFNVQEGTVSPDGFSRYAQTINGSIPGPTIIADWGDMVVVHVTNSIPGNGSSIHFHGIRQNYTNMNDGVPSVTQCPIAPGDTYTYKWRATQYGSSWYHSHVGLQAWEGVAGGIIINGPATANYDEDKGSMFLSDWGHTTVDEQYSYAQNVGPPIMDTGLMNGTNVFGADGASNQTGSHYQTSVQAGTSYRFRIVNSAINTHFKFSVDNHTMTVMTTDFVPIQPYQTDILNIGIGQRYDVIITANQGAIASDFWIRAIAQISCSTTLNPSIKGILHYGSSTALPTTTGYAFTDECVDEPAANLVPFVPKTVSSNIYSANEAVTVAQNSNNLFRWYLNNSTFESDWKDPTILQVQKGVSSFAAADNLISIPKAGEWVYLVIHADLPVPHPIHLHGHDFFVLAQSSGTYDASTVTYNLNNPPRRDVALLPAAGYLVLAFETDNPGAWLAHCHIGWHTSQGFALQFLEMADQIPGILDVDTLQGTCDSWDATAIMQEDSGV